MRELERSETDLWTIVYDVCVRTVEWLELEPFEAGRLHIAATTKLKSKKEIIAMVDNFRSVVQKREIDFEKMPLMEDYPEVKNEHIYLGIEKHIEYFERMLPYLQV